MLNALAKSFREKIFSKKRITFLVLLRIELLSFRRSVIEVGLTLLGTSKIHIFS
ncbi:hypothetical protein SAMN05660816_06858 [Niastella yeongjuensis]|nr:hypothetical protein SAMN05660816_06858 [Niastella yeongjuensis]